MQPLAMPSSNARARAAARCVALAAALACAPAASATARPDARPDIVVFVIDTLRADRVGAYRPDGGTAAPGVRAEAEAGATPHIDSLARRGVVFEHANAPAPWTLPSVVSLMTSTFPCEHGVRVDGERLRDDLVPLAEHLRRAGYATTSFVSNGFAGKTSGLDRGFDHHAMLASIGGETLRRWYRPPPDRPIFLYLHDVRPHDPYQAAVVSSGGAAPDAAARDAANRRLHRYRQLTKVDFAAGRTPGATDNTEEQQRAMTWLAAHRDEIEVLYGAEVHAADDVVGDVVGELVRIGRWDDTLFVLTSDHGEEFDDHGGWQHDQSLYQELVRVPLVVRLPGDEAAGLRVAEPVSLVDLVPTIAEWLDLPEIAAHARGRSWVPLLRRADGERAGGAPRVVAERDDRKKYYAPFVAARGRRNVAVRDGAWKAIWSVEPGRLELYDLSRDPRERRDRSAEEPARAAAMERAARAWLAGCRAPDAPKGPLDDADRERLRALGYVE